MLLVDAVELKVSILAKITVVRGPSRCGVRVKVVVQPLGLLVMMTKLQPLVPRWGRNIFVDVPMVCNAALALLDR